MSFNHYESNLSFDQFFGQEEALCEFNTVNAPEESWNTSANNMNLEVPLYEDYPTTFANDESVASMNVIEPKEVPSSAFPHSFGIQDCKMKTTRFNVVYRGPCKMKSSKQVSPVGSEPTTSTVTAIESIQNNVYHPYMTGYRLQSRSTNRRTEKTAFTYPNMAYLALLNAPNRQAYVADIYDFMLYNFPYFSTAPNAWKNCVRNNIANSRYFEKVKGQYHTSKGDMWRVKDDSSAKLMEDVNKVIRKSKLEDLKLRNPKDLDDILNGRAGIKIVSSPKSVPVHNQMIQYPNVNPIPTCQHIPFYPPSGFAPMSYPMFFDFAPQPSSFSQ